MSSKIHPTAIIDSKAEVAEGAEIGPFCIIEADARIDSGTRLDSNIRIYSGTKIGKNNHIGHGAVLGCFPQHLTFDKSLKTGLVIGDNNTFREYANIHRSSKVGEPTTIGNNNYIMGFTHLGHDCHVGNENVIAGAMIAGHVTIDNNSFISALVGIHQFCRVGSFAMVGGCSKITQDIPPFMMIDDSPAAITGINLIGLKRAGFSEERLRSIKNAFKKLFRRGKYNDQVLAEVKATESSPDVQYLVNFITDSQRGTLIYQKPS